MYRLQYKTDKTDTVQVVLFNSLFSLLQQVKTDFNTKVLNNIDQLISVTYTQKDKQTGSAMITLLDNLKHSLKDDLKDQAVQRLNYLKMCC